MTSKNMTLAQFQAMWGLFIIDIIRIQWRFILYQDEWKELSNYMSHMPDEHDFNSMTSLYEYRIHPDSPKFSFEFISLDLGI